MQDFDVYFAFSWLLFIIVPTIIEINLVDMLENSFNLCISVAIYVVEIVLEQPHIIIVLPVGDR